MRKKWTAYVRALFVFSIAAVLFSCQGEVVEKQHAAHKVGFYAGEGLTRTTMLPDGLYAVWESDDKLAVWAKHEQSGSFVLSNQIFATYGIDNELGVFTSTLESPMPEGSYTYYCCYPVPQAVSGTNVTFDIPSVQDGRVSGGAGIMIATPVTHGPLTAVPDPEDHSGMSLIMKHMLHQFRFYIPENNSVMDSEQITKLELTFPKGVCGKATADLAASSQSLELTEPVQKIVLKLDDPMLKSCESQGEYDYACVALMPVDFEEGDQLSIRAFTADRIAKIDPVDLRSKSLEAGHSTPVKLIVKEIVDYPYAINFTLSENNVGENVTSVKLTAPSGCVWPASGTNVYVYNPGREILAGESIISRFADYSDYSAFSGKAITVELETENTITTSTATIAEIPSGVESHTSQISASVPYLLYQNFSSIGSYSDGHDGPKVGTSSDTYKGITELSAAGLPGWYGTRVGIQSGASARICCRYEHVLLAGAYYKGRLYTPQFTRIKEGKDVKIQVSFSYGSNREERKPMFGSRPDKSPYLYFGINNQDVVINPDQTEGDLMDQVTGLVAGSGYASNTPTSLSPMVIKGEKLDKENGSYTSLPKSKTVTIEGVDRDSRLGWILSTDNTASNTNANYWFYIDNIVVKIVK